MGRPGKKITHKIRHSKGGTVELELTRNRAIKAFCTECMGWETHPKDCTATLCPLFPYRAKSLIAILPPKVA